MSLFTFSASLLTLAALFSYLNARFMRRPAGIMFLLLGVGVALGVLAWGHIVPSFTVAVRGALLRFDFTEFLMGSVLSFLLFAGSLHVRVDALRAVWRSIAAYSTLGVLLATGLVGLGTYVLLHLAGVELPLLPCLLFGALIAPTDPIAVLGILKTTDLDKNIETNLAGESLFNDGFGVVVFVTLLEVATPGETPSAGSAALLLLREAGGGLLAGGVLAYVGYRLIKTVDHFQTEVMLTLALVMGGYALCHALGVSGPLAMVVAGLAIGNVSRSGAVSDTTRDYLEKFWEALDEVLNAVLFVLMGLELVVIGVSPFYLGLGVAAAVLALLVRYVVLTLTTGLLGLSRQLPPRTLAILSWGGLRGGISLALALGLPTGLHPEVFVPMTFAVVLFSAVVQGLTLKRLLGWLTSRPA
ncbi:cation:proton antiporter [Hymenobacter artigasi]|uniref:CPA1 family monovalent cation:H+ antiporter n=1 Tax=Hymenobacter artigasi TaxID=2719616 RepID=A0ABX1HEI1_9BACT|nr:sodium:proton antiporter [Hymenobacter artigasi]NKI88654.1 CPA1 family monovalent cation:H+ antiporter [Hymenobacter artigasi]